MTYKVRVITKFIDLPIDLQLKFGKERSKDIPAMFISTCPLTYIRSTGKETTEDIEIEYFGDNAFKKGTAELRKLLRKGIEIEEVVKYKPSPEQTYE